MLAMYGPVVFDLRINLHKTVRKTEAQLVDKPVIGIRPPVEFTGDGPETINLSVRLYPEHLGGMSFLTAVNAIRQAGIPQYFMRGDGQPLGWFLTQSCEESSEYLDPEGVGRVMDVELTLKRAGAPLGADFFATIEGML